MRIDGPRPREVEQSGKIIERPVSPSPIQGGDATGNSSHAGSRELKALLDRVELLPDVRSDAVAEIARRLNAGVLSTGDALARTAEALQSAPGTIVPSGAKAPPSDAKSDIPGEIEAALGRIPHVRQDVVAEASRRLREGELSNLDAIRRTASAIL